jgi:beta-lactamase regulating signal transducer with metallopeptidase domain
VIERVVEYVANALWQLPLLAVGAWWLLRAARLGPLAQHRVWVMVLGLGVVLPVARVAPREVMVRPVVMARVADLDARTTVDIPLREVRDDLRTSWVRKVLQRRSVEVREGLARGLTGIYLVLMVLGLVRIARSWCAAQRLVLEAADVALSPELRSLLAECGRIVGVGLPRVVESGEVSSPAVVGKVLVLPKGFVGYAEDEIRAALLHELAHLRRRDFGRNLLYEMAGLPVVWHPVSYVVRARIRSTREMVCDGIAAGAMGSATVYARSLVGLAAKACTGGREAQPTAVGLFTNNHLEERVMQLMKTKQTMDVRGSVLRGMSAAAGMIAAVVLTATVHVTPAMAQQVAPASSVQTASGDRGTQVTTTPKIASGQSVPPEDVPAAGSVAEGTSAGVGTSSAEGASGADKRGVGSAEGLTGRANTAGGLHDGVAAADDLKGGLTAASVFEEVDKQCPMGQGTHAHHWITSEGKDFWTVNCDAQEPTAEQKKAMEKKFHEQVGVLQKQMAELKTDELKLNGQEMKRQLADAQKQLAKAAAQMNSPEFRRQIAEVSSPEFQKQMEELKLQMANAKLDKLDIQEQLKNFNTQNLDRQMAELNKEVSTIVNKEVKKQIQEQMEAALKQIEAARKLMEKERLRKHPDATCMEDCWVAPK